MESVSNSISIIYTLTMPSPYIHNSPGEIVADRQHFLTDAHPDFLRVSWRPSPNMSSLFILPRCQIYGSTGGLVPENQLCFDNASSLQASATFAHFFNHHQQIAAFACLLEVEFSGGWKVKSNRPNAGSAVCLIGFARCYSVLEPLKLYWCQPNCRFGASYTTKFSNSNVFYT